jgi:Uma2 family endonuclease
MLMNPAGGDPGYAADEIFVAIREFARQKKYEKQKKHGRAVGSNKGFRVNLSNREIFSPDAAYYLGIEAGMKFYEGAPIFAVEVRNENDYGDNAEKSILALINDYFAAGALVVWDVDILSNDVIKVYRKSDPANPAIYKKGESAEASPALPGWKFPVNNLFDTAG